VCYSDSLCKEVEVQTSTRSCSIRRSAHTAQNPSYAKAHTDTYADAGHGGKAEADTGAVLTLMEGACSGSASAKLGGSAYAGADAEAYAGIWFGRSMAPGLDGLWLLLR
jgi:hypothetical protein